MNSELPSISSSGYASNTINAQWFENPQWGSVGDDCGKMAQAFGSARTATEVSRAVHQRPPMTATEVIQSMKNTKRVVKVFVADPDEKVPAEKSLLYTGEERVTDLTDQELFFEVDIKPLLQKHNAERTKIVDKEASQKFGKDVLLEPIKIRDLRMTVVVVAQF